jgi:hypothetical protein
MSEHVDNRIADAEKLNGRGHLCLFMQVKNGA